MDVTVTRRGEDYAASLSGRLVFSDNPEFRRLLEDVAAARAKRCVLDLAELASVDSAGLGMFVVAADAATRHGWSLVLSRPAGQVKQLLTLARFDRIMTIEGAA